MTLRAARTHIRTVRFKSGGVVRLLRKPKQPNRVVEHMMAWARGQERDPCPPDAYAAVALTYDKNDPGRPLYSVTYISAHDGLPASVVCRTAAMLILEEAAVFRAECRIADKIGLDVGWEPPEPDPAA